MPRAQQISAGEAPEAITSFRLKYLTPHAFEATRSAGEGRILGAIAFGAEPRALTAPDFPFAWVDMPVLGAGTMFEVWLSEEPVIRDAADGVASARNDEVLFGCVQLEHPGSLDEASYIAYGRVFDFIDSRGYSNLLRVWNYFPQINRDAEGLERYRRFCRGRHDAFCAKGRIIGEDTPAASALGSRAGPLTVYFLAGKAAGERVENPRQTSAYHYPAQYGPRSPTFSRGTLMWSDSGALLFISGTAGIVGHETQHPGDAAEQARVTVENIRAVVAQAHVGGMPDRSGKFAFKAYVRHPDYLPAVRDALEKCFGDGCETLYLQADICRRDLLLEIEGMYADEGGAPG